MPLLIRWDPGPEGIDFCHEHCVDFIFCHPIHEFACFFVPVFNWRTFYVPEHYPMTVLLLGGWFGVSPVVGDGFWGGAWWGSGETHVFAFQLMSWVRWDGVQTKCHCRGPLRGVRLAWMWGHFSFWGDPLCVAGSWERGFGKSRIGICLSGRYLWIRGGCYKFGGVLQESEV